MAEELQNQHGAAKPEPDVEAHGNHPMIDDDPDELKTKLANDEDDDVEAHSQHGKAHGKQHAG
jgi:hypothetical protein